MTFNDNALTEKRLNSYGHMYTMYILRHCSWTRAFWGIVDREMRSICCVFIHDNKPKHKKFLIGHMLLRRKACVSLYWNFNHFSLHVLRVEPKIPDILLRNLTDVQIQSKTKIEFLLRWVILLVASRSVTVDNYLYISIGKTRKCLCICIMYSVVMVRREFKCVVSSLPWIDRWTRECRGLRSSSTWGIRLWIQ